MFFQYGYFGVGSDPAELVPGMCSPVLRGLGWLISPEHSHSPVLELINFLGNWNMILLESSCVQQGWPGARTEWASTCWFLHFILHHSLFQEGETKVSRWWWRSQLEPRRLTSRVLCSTKPAKCLLGLTNDLFGLWSCMSLQNLTAPELVLFGAICMCVSAWINFLEIRIIRSLFIFF